MISALGASGDGVSAPRNGRFLATLALRPDAAAVLRQASIADMLGQADMPGIGPQRHCRASGFYRQLNRAAVGLQFKQFDQRIGG